MPSGYPYPMYPSGASGGSGTNASGEILILESTSTRRPHGAVKASLTIVWAAYTDLCTYSLLESAVTFVNDGTLHTEAHNPTKGQTTALCSYPTYMVL